jgi:hypothetical protein
LILISNDIQHSFSRLLPQPQQIQAVSFKREIEYKGAFLEEWVDIGKLKMYFEFFKANNPLFKDYVLDQEKLQQFEKETIEAAEYFEKQVIESNMEESSNSIATPKNKEGKRRKRIESESEKSFIASDSERNEKATGSKSDDIPSIKKKLKKEK